MEVYAKVSTFKQHAFIFPLFNNCFGGCRSTLLMQLIIQLKSSSVSDNKSLKLLINASILNNISTKIQLCF